MGLYGSGVEAVVLLSREGRKQCTRVKKESIQPQADCKLGNKNNYWQHHWPSSPLAWFPHLFNSSSTPFSAHTIPSFYSLFIFSISFLLHSSSLSAVTFSFFTFPLSSVWRSRKLKGGRAKCCPLQLWWPANVSYSTVPSTAITSEHRSLAWLPLQHVPWLPGRSCYFWHFHMSLRH